MLTLLIALVLLFSSFDSFSQVVKKPGIVMLYDSTRLNCWIDYDDWNRTPKKLKVYLDSLSRDKKVYDISQVNYFQVNDYDAYVRLPHIDECTKVSPHQRNQHRLFQRFQRDTAMFKVLVSGNYTLTEFNHNEHIHYHLYSKNGVTELHAGRLHIEDAEFDGYVDDERYKDQLLRQIGMDNIPDSLKSELVNTIYHSTNYDLVSIVHRMNNGSTIYVLPDQRSHGPQTFNSIVVGLGSGRLRLRDQVLSESTGMISSIHGHFDIRGSEFNHGLMGRVGIGWTFNRFKGFAYYTFDNAFSVFYTFRLKNADRLYFGPTIEIQHIHLGQNASQKVSQFSYGYIIDHYFPLKVNMGWIHRNKWELGLEATLQGSVEQDLPIYNNPRSFKISIARYFRFRDILNYLF